MNIETFICTDRRSCRPGMARFIIMVACCVQYSCLSAGDWHPIKSSTYPQKFRTFYALTNAAVPRALRSDPTPLPLPGVTAWTLASDGAVWLGTTQGLMRLDTRTALADQRQFFGGKRYLPDDRVQQIEADQNAGVWVRTATGVSHIELRPMTLAQKASLFEERIRARHDRNGLVADSWLRVPGDLSSNQMIDNDNDGLWTSIYAAAECFRYAVTKSPEALRNAKRSIEAMLFLEQVAGGRGFPARSFVRKGDPLPHDGEWHWTADGQYYWKGDTSSDEIVGHFFIFGIASDLLPDLQLKARIRATAKRVMDHILEHNYTLTGLDGKPTTWGWWGPEKLVHEPDERALNSLQLLSFLKVTAHLTGEAKYEAEYRKAAWDFHYAEWMTRVNEFRQEMNYSDEELAMLPFYCLFRYEKDPNYLKFYRQAVDEWWRNEQREANPLWTFFYALGHPDQAIDFKPALWTLYRTPLDMICWSVRNSHRQDIAWAPAGDRFGQREVITLLAPDERPVMRWNSNPFVVDGGDAGAREDDGAAFLLPYWLGRYHGMLKEK